MVVPRRRKHQPSSVCDDTEQYCVAVEYRTLDRRSSGLELCTEVEIPMRMELPRESLGTGESRRVHRRKLMGADGDGPLNA